MIFSFRLSHCKLYILFFGLYSMHILFDLILYMKFFTLFVMHRVIRETFPWHPLKPCVQRLDLCRTVCACVGPCSSGVDWSCSVTCDLGLCGSRGIEAHSGWSLWVRAGPQWVWYGLAGSELVWVSPVEQRRIQTGPVLNVCVHFIK